MRIIGLFIKWIVAKVGQGLCNLNKNFYRDLKNEPIPTSFVWLMFAFIATMVELIMVAIFAVVTQTNPSGWWVVGFALILFAHYVVTGVSVMFQCFKQERRELFDTIKNS